MAEHPNNLNPADNRILAALPADVKCHLFRELELLPLAVGTVLFDGGDALPYVYFPTDAIVSMLCVMEEGRSAEIAVVGNDGLVGISVFMGGGGSSANRALVRGAGSAFRLPSQALKEEFDRHGALLDVVLRYTQARITQMAQTVVCYRHHTVEQQLCRLLLLTLDRLPDNRLRMTQQLIANMLSVRREGITEAAGKLQKLRVIEYRRGRITVLDRPRLEQLSCECYEVVRREVERLLPPTDEVPVEA
jgi:CRP-like cAMP-binding protein